MKPGRALINAAILVTVPVWGGVFIVGYLLYDDPEFVRDFLLGERKFFG